MSPSTKNRALPFSAWYIGLCFLVASCKKPVEVYDGFEGNKLSTAWSTDRLVEGAVEFQPVVVRAGKGAVKITVHQGDLYEGIDPLQSKPTERDELREHNSLVSHENGAFAYSFSIYIPNDFPIVPVRLVLAQLKQWAGNNTVKADSPVVALRYVNGLLGVTLQTTPKQNYLFRTDDDIRGRWIDFVFHLKFTRTNTGLVRVWMDGKPVVDYRGTTAYVEEYGYPEKGFFYFKMGLYRDRMEQPMNAYFDEYRKRPLTTEELK
jgi:hypothetical protein